MQEVAGTIPAYNRHKSFYDLHIFVSSALGIFDVEMM